MSKYSLLIIDDDWEVRSKDYESLLGSDFFDFEYIKNGNELELIKDKRPHGFILDMDLSRWISNNFNDKDLFLKATELIGNKGPVFLISSKWNAEVVTWLNNSREIQVVHFISWNDDVIEVLKSINNDSIVPTRLNIKNELDKHYQRERQIIGPNDQIVLLDISDMQFGDAMTDTDSALLEDLIPKFLRQERIKIDLLLITGDISYQGFPTEFHLAKEWIKHLCKKLFKSDENYKSRILLIPGNHDVNLKLTSVDNYNFDFKTKKLVKGKPDTSAQHHSYGLLPFRQFAFELTGNSNWITNETSLFFVDDRFLHWGIRFYMFNSVAEQTYKEPDKKSAPITHLKYLIDAPEVKDDIYKIILSHHGPNHLGFEFDSPEKGWRQVRNFIETIGAKLYLYGHVHKSLTFKLPEQGVVTRNVEYHMAATLTLNKNARTDNSQRGFSIIELKRKNGVITKHKIRTFNLEGERCRETTKD
jgi:Icc-related predicted phosphoesterase